MLNCYSDEIAANKFNTDNCNDTFLYSTVAQMADTVALWQWGYETKQYVRMTIMLNDSGEKIGTIEMFNKGTAMHYGVIGVLRIDIMNPYETKDVLHSIFDLAHTHFYRSFGVEWIFTKLTETAKLRTEVANDLGYVHADNYHLEHYYGRHIARNYINE
ncbi:MAG: hypothetical protein JW739_05130 [Opitutales bacterium]|nr:hypothetical protein [Opitutales bacterium]